MKKTFNASEISLLLMKIGGLPVVFILMLINVSLASSSLAQDILQSEITYGHSSKSLETVLDEIEKSKDIHFTYSIQKIDVSQPVELVKKTTTLASLLDELLHPLAIKYQVFNNRNIVLSKKRATPSIKSGTTLTGAVYNQDREPIQFANVLLTKSVSSEERLRGAVTDELGKFSINKIDPGEYNLRISFIGFVSMDTVLVIDESTDLGTIIMSDDLNTLSGISVTARRKLIRQEIDRLIVAVENSMLANRGTAMDVLASTPGITVTNDNITMIGKSSVGIMVDDKIINLSPEEIGHYLRSIASDDIMQIEVISNPPAKYEALGNSGLINIVLKKARKDSWTTTVRSGYSQKTNGAAHTGLNFAYNKNKLSVASSLFFIDGKYYQEQDDYAYFPDGLWYTSSPILSDYQRINARVDLSYQLNDNWSIGSQFMRNTTDYLITDNPYTPVLDYQTNEVQRYLLSTFSQMTWKPQFNSLNVNSSVNLDTSGRKMHVNLDYFDYQIEDIRQYVGESVITNEASKQHYAGFNENQRAVENLSAAIDFDHPTVWGNIGYGAKVTQSTSTNDILLFNSGLVDEEVSALPLKANDFTYVEKLQAAYVSMTRPITTQLNLQAGLRVEATQTQSSSENLNLDEPNDYIKAFPTLYLSFNPSDKASYGFNYGRRIGRPTFGQLNPNVFFINPFQTIVGNAFLQPSFTDNVELSASHGNLTSKLYFSRELDIFAQIPLPNSETNIITFANENYVNTNRYGLSEFYVFDKLPWWSSSNSFDLNYSVSSFDLPTAHDKLKGFSSSISTSNDFTIKPIAGLSLNLSYWYAFRGRNYIFNTGQASNLSGSVQYLLMDNRLKLSLAVNDIFKDSAEILEATVNEVFQTARYYYDSRTINFTVSYSFGNNNISAKQHRTGNSEERNRASN